MTRSPENSRNLGSAVEIIHSGWRRLTRSGSRLPAPLVAALWLLASAASGQEGQIHGADSVFTSPGITIVWAVLRDEVEDRSVVVVRIAGMAGRYRYLRVEGVDPFTGRRAPVVDIRLAEATDVRSLRRSFADLPRREIHFYATEEDWRAGRPALTVYYLGVPDTTPEFASEASLSAYLSAASARRGLPR